MGPLFTGAYDLLILGGHLRFRRDGPRVTSDLLLCDSSGFDAACIKVCSRG
jgi:hypothetical protein